MTDHNDPAPHQGDDYDSDSKADVIAAVSLIAIAVVFMIFWVSNQ